MNQNFTDMIKTNQTLIKLYLVKQCLFCTKLTIRCVFKVGFRRIFGQVMIIDKCALVSFFDIKDL